MPETEDELQKFSKSLKWVTGQETFFKAQNKIDKQY